MILFALVLTKLWAQYRSRFFVHLLSVVYLCRPTKIINKLGTFLENNAIQKSKVQNNLLTKVRFSKKKIIFLKRKKKFSFQYTKNFAKVAT